MESQNNKIVAMLASQTNPAGVELFSYVNTFFCSNKFAWLLAMQVLAMQVKILQKSWYPMYKNFTHQHFQGKKAENPRHYLTNKDINIINTNYKYKLAIIYI